MTIPDPFTETVGRLQGCLGSIANFDRTHIRTNVDTTAERAPREFAIVATYLRIGAQIGTLLELKHERHFQAIATIVRSILELVVDLYLIDRIGDGATKYSVFSDAERLRAARRIVNFYVDHDVPPLATLGVYEQFIAENETTIQASAAATWPNVPLSNIKHWSLRDLRSRAVAIGEPFVEMYDVHYAKLSWFAHPGVGAIATMDARAYLAACGDAFGLAGQCYNEALRFMIRELQLPQIDLQIEQKLEFSRVAPFAQNEAEAMRL